MLRRFYTTDGLTNWIGLFNEPLAILIATVSTQLIGTRFGPKAGPTSYKQFGVLYERILLAIDNSIIGDTLRRIADVPYNRALIADTYADVGEKIESI